MKLGLKLALGLLAILVLMVALAVFAARQAKGDLMESVGRSTVLLAEEKIKRLDAGIVRRVDELQMLAQEPWVQSAVANANSKTEGLDPIEREATLAQLERVASKDGTATWQVWLDSEISRTLGKEFVQFHEKKYGYRIFEHILITDRFGILLAQAGRRPTLRVSDEAWWQQAQTKNGYVSNARLDVSGKKHVIDVAVSVFNQERRFIGVIMGECAFDGIVQESQISSDSYETSEIRLIDASARLIYSSLEYRFLADLSAEDFFAGLKGRRGFFVAQHGDSEGLFSYASSDGYRSWPGLGWRLVVRHDVDEVLKPIAQLNYSILLIAVMAILPALAIAFALARSITRPIRLLTQATEKISEGEEPGLDTSMLSSGDELGELARSFSSMSGALRMRQKQFRDLFDNSPDPILIHDTRETILDVSHAATELLGRDRGQLIGTNMLDLFVGGEQAAMDSRSLKKGEIHAFTATVKRSNGVSVPVEVRCSRIEYDGARASLLHVRDVTERKLSEQALRNARDELEARVEERTSQLNQANTQLEEDLRKREQAERELLESEEKLREAIKVAEAASRTKSDFLANMSHEIRTPMNGVLGMTELLFKTGLDEDQREYADVVRASAESLLTILNDILDISKVEEGKLDIEHIPFDLRATLDQVTESLAYRARQKGLEFILHYTPDAPRHVVGDPGRIRQVITNLAGNAIKFTHSGHVVIRVQAAESQEESTLLRLSVEDTGIGIPRDRHEAVFEKFTQADSTTTRQYGGTGLGLSISRELIQIMGGRMGLESSPGQGSTFWFELKMPLPAEPPAPEMPLADLNGLRVLIVDDNEISRKVLSEELSSEGIEGKECNNGVEAVTVLREAAAKGDPFDAALVDQNMPGMDGESLGRLIKEEPSISDAVLILLTSAGQRGDANRFKAAGFEGYLTKPVRSRVLLQALSAAIGVAKSGQPAALVTQHSLAESAMQNAAGQNDDHFSARVLIVEDNSVNQQVALGMLRLLGCDAEIACNGREALEKVETKVFDLIYMDIQMPEMDGSEATAAIRNLEDDSSNTPIVAMTAHAMSGERERCLAAGMNDYMSKPVTEKEFVRTLRRWTNTEVKDVPDSVADDSGGAEESSQRSGESSAIEDQPQTNDPEAIDPERWKSLVQTAEGVGPDFLGQLVGTFIQDIKNRERTISDAIEKGDLKQLGLACHGLKGSAANMGASALSKAAASLEHLSEEGDPKGLDGHLNDLVSLVRQTEAELADLAEISPAGATE